MAWTVERSDKRGRTVVHVQWREGGRVRSKSTGGNDLRRTADLLEWAQGREGTPQPACDVRTPEEALDRFLRHLLVVEGRAPETGRWYRGKLKGLVEAWADFPMRSWSRPLLELYVRDKREAGWSDATYNGFLAACTSWISWSRAAGGPFGDFVGGLRRAIVEETEKVPLTEAQVFHLIASAKSYGVRLVLALAGLTGMRRAEILRLTWDDVDLEARELRVRGKTKKGRTVAIHDRLHEILLEKPGVRGNVLRTHRHGTALYAGLRAAYRAAEIPYPAGNPLHGLRTALATNLLEKGYSMDVVRRILGHRDIRTTALYAKPRKQKQQEALRGYGG